jgi:hypothetical protein
MFAHYCPSSTLMCPYVCVQALLAPTALLVLRTRLPVSLGATLRALDRRLARCAQSAVMVMFVNSCYFVTHAATCGRVRRHATPCDGGRRCSESPPDLLPSSVLRFSPFLVVVVPSLRFFAFRTQPGVRGRSCVLVILCHRVVIVCFPWRRVAAHFSPQLPPHPTPPHPCLV